MLAPLRLNVELEQEAPGRWIAEVVGLPGVMVYGPTKAAALRRAQVLALEVIADRLKHEEDILTGRPIKKAVALPAFGGVRFATA